MWISGIAAAAAVAAVPAIGQADGMAALPDAAQSAIARPANQQCQAGECHFSLSANQMLVAAERFVMTGQFAAAEPLVAALGQAPEYALQHRFLSGMIAMGKADYPTAEKWFRAILNESPGQSRVRLELARALLAMGKESAADYHLRLVQDDGDLPDSVAQTIRSTRGIIRDQRVWRFSFDMGLAPDTNINNATSAKTVDVNFGSFQLPLTLNDDARSRSGLGQTGNYSAGLRLRMDDGIAMLIESDGRMVNYRGQDADDVQVQMAIGPEVAVDSETRLSMQGFGDYRWYAGNLATREFGMQLGLQHIFGEGQRLGLRVDGRKSLSALSDNYSGWTYGASATYERVVAHRFIASSSLFAQKSDLADNGYSYSSVGVSAGLGGELPLGLNAGVSGSVSFAGYKAPLLMYSNEKRGDWRYSSRLYMGLRKMRLIGFSPSVDYVFSKTDSNYDLFKSDRHRVNFKFSRYF